MKYVPVAAILMTVFIIDLWFAAGRLRPTSPTAASSWRAKSSTSFAGLRVALRSRGHRLLLRPLCRAALRHHADRAAPPRRARIIAANNIVNAIFMTRRPIVSAILIKAGFYGARPLPLPRLRQPLAAVLHLPPAAAGTGGPSRAMVFRFLYGVEVKGIENFHAAGAQGRHRRQPYSRCSMGRSLGLPPRARELRHQHPYGRALVGEAGLPSLQIAAHRSRQSDGAARPWSRSSRRATRSSSSRKGG